MGSHDTARILTIAGGDIKTVELATLLLFTFPGAPCIYYGDEVGLEGGLDPDCRRTFPAPQDWNTHLLEYHKELIRLRHQYISLRRGIYDPIYADDNIYVFSRSYKEETLVVVVNIDEHSHHVPLKIYDFPVKIKEKIWGNGSFNYEQKEGQDHIILHIPPRSGMILH